MIPAESAHDTIGALGDVGLLQFKDLNADKSAFQRTYANQVRGVLRLESSQFDVCCQIWRAQPIARLHPPKHRSSAAMRWPARCASSTTRSRRPASRPACARCSTRRSTWTSSRCVGVGVCVCFRGGTGARTRRRFFCRRPPIKQQHPSNKNN